MRKAVERYLGPPRIVAETLGLTLAAIVGLWLLAWPLLWLSYLFGER